MTERALRALLELLGYALVLAGTALVYMPAALILAGVACVFVAIRPRG